MIRSRWHVAFDSVRWTLILAGWAVVTVLLWNRAGWIWAALGMLPVFVIVLNVVGLATAPFYWGLNARQAERRLIEELLAKRRGNP